MERRREQIKKENQTSRPGDQHVNNSHPRNKGQRKYKGRNLKENIRKFLPELKNMGLQIEKAPLSEQHSERKSTQTNAYQ